MRIGFIKLRVKYNDCFSQNNTNSTISYRCNPESDLSFPGFGSTCGGSSTSMAYLKSAPYPVPGLGLHGLPVDSLHSSMAYPGGKILHHIRNFKYNN